jgi:hypothetical protein
MRYHGLSELDSLVFDGNHHSIDLGSCTLFYQFSKDGECYFKIQDNYSHDMKVWCYR